MATKKTTKTFEDWVQASVYEDVELPSGFKVDIKLPDLAEVLQSGEFPQHLLEAALNDKGDDKDDEPTPEKLRQATDFQNHIVLKTVVAPKLTAEQVGQLDPADRDLLFLIGTRQRDWDAMGNPISKLVDVGDWKRFRGFTNVDPSLED